jgi:hypothetical protein
LRQSVGFGPVLFPALARTEVLSTTVSAGRAHRADGSPPGVSRANAARRRRVASGPADAGRCSPSPRPSGVGAFATECRTEARIRCRSEWRDPEWASGRAGVRVDADVAESTGSVMPRSHRQPAHEMPDRTKPPGSVQEGRQ